MSDPSCWCPEYDEFVQKALDTGDWLLLLEIYESTLISQQPLSKRIYDELALLLDCDQDLKLLIDQAISSFSR